LSSYKEIIQKSIIGVLTQKILQNADLIERDKNFRQGLTLFTTNTHRQ
jgi:hypothetical protein